MQTYTAFQITKADNSYSKYTFTEHDTTKENIDTFKSNTRETISIIDKGDMYHNKYHMIFFQLHEDADSTTMDLCEAFKWCKHSRILENTYYSRNQYIHGVAIETPLIRCVAIAQVISNPQGCKRILFEYGNGTVRLHAWKEEGYTHPVFVGISLCTPNACMNCKTIASPTSKLKACSKCFHTAGRVRILYCSKECQRMDYRRHRNACTYDWSKDDWQADQCLQLTR
jgi:hypothetical protein